jgi:hypothetical protein
MPSKPSAIDLPECQHRCGMGKGRKACAKLLYRFLGIRLVLACISIYQISRITGIIMVGGRWFPDEALEFGALFRVIH